MTFFCLPALFLIFPCVPLPSPKYHHSCWAKLWKVPARQVDWSAVAYFAPWIVYSHRTPKKLYFLWSTWTFYILPLFLLALIMLLFWNTSLHAVFIQSCFQSHKLLETVKHLKIHLQVLYVFLFSTWAVESKAQPGESTQDRGLQGSLPLLKPWVPLSDKPM